MKIFNTTFAKAISLGSLTLGALVGTPLTLMVAGPATANAEPCGYYRGNVSSDGKTWQNYFQNCSGHNQLARVNKEFTNFTFCSLPGRNDLGQGQVWNIDNIKSVDVIAQSC